MIIKIIVALLGFASIFSGIIGFARYSVHERYHQPEDHIDDLLSYIMIICGLLCAILAWGYIN